MDINRAGDVVKSAIVFAFAAAATTLALPPGRYLEPLWSYSSMARLEWVAVADDSAILATIGGEVRVFDPNAGPDWGVPVLSAAPGVRFAGSADGHLFLFDRWTVYALVPCAPETWAWQFAMDAMPAGRPDDPEQLPGWNEVVAIAGGALVATGDGRLLWLASDDGRPRWELKLGRWSAARLLAQPEHAAVVWSESGGLSAALLPVTTRVPEPTRVTLAGEAPLWLGLTADGLLFVTPERLTTWSWDGQRHDATPAIRPRRAAALTILEAGEPWLLLAVGTRPQALDARTGALMWGTLGTGSPRLTIETLSCVRDELVAVNALGPVVYEAATGRTSAGCRRATGRLVGWHLTDTQLHALYLSPGFTDPVGELVSAPRGGGRTAAWTLVPTGSVRQVAWTGELMLVLENHALRAYRLP